MTQDEIILMADASGISLYGMGLDRKKFIYYLEAFAKLVAQHEREIWERRCERLQSLMDIRETQPNKPCCLAEREACAKVCEEQYEYYGHDHVFAKAIRARGQA